MEVSSLEAESTDAAALLVSPMASLSEPILATRVSLPWAADCAFDGDLAGRGILLPDRAGDVRGDLVDVAHGVADFAHRIDGISRRGLDQADILADLGGRFGGLPGQRLDLVRHHREAAAGLAGARSLDGRVQRQQIGLLGDRLDQGEYAVDALGRCGETFDLGDRLFGPQAGLFDHAGGLTDLAADLLAPKPTIPRRRWRRRRRCWRPARSRRRRRPRVRLHRMPRW